MTNDTLINFRAPRSLLNDFHAYAREEGVTLSEVLREALRARLDSASAVPPPSSEGASSPR